MTFDLHNPDGAPVHGLDRLIGADWLVVHAERVLPMAGIWVRRGRVHEIVSGPKEWQRWSQATGLEPEYRAGTILAPGWVNAHAHLDLSALAGQVSAQGGFFDWVKRLMQAKASQANDAQAGGEGSECEVGLWEHAVRVGVQQLLRTGTTCVGDIDSSGDSARWLTELPIRSVVFREWLDAHQPERTAQVAEQLASSACATLPSSAVDAVGAALSRTSHGLSPHAGFTVSPALLRAVAALSKPRGCPVSTHWAETQEEVDWLATGRGAMATWLGPSPRASGLELLERAGLLNAQLSLVHGNHPAPGDWERIAASQATVVHCPGSHRFFARDPFPFEAVLQAGVRLALGTDSWASNDQLSMGAEVRRLRTVCPAIDAPTAYRMATEHGAFALGLGGRVGRLEPGYAADGVRVPCSVDSPERVLEALTKEAWSPDQVWVAGQTVPL